MIIFEATPRLEKVFRRKRRRFLARCGSFWTPIPDSYSNIASSRRAEAISFLGLAKAND